MSYEYKDHEIFARVHQTGSALYEIDEHGNITDEVPDCDIVHDDQTIVWYEVEVTDPESGITSMSCNEAKTLAEAKQLVDKSIKYNKENYNE